MSEKTYLLGVDDEEINLEILREIFEDEYDLECVESGQACLALVAEKRPEVILLDVNMPGIDGLEVCRQIRLDAGNSDIQIIFVSALSSNEEKLAGYEAGGDDYVTKPFEADELKVKVKKAFSLAEKRAVLKHSSDNSMQVAMTAMTNAAELGQVLHFLRDSFTCKTVEALGDKVLAAIKQYGVSGSLFLKSDEDNITLFSDGIERPLESSALNILQSKGRIHSFGDKVIFNGENASLLIRNVPEDSDKAGRLRDHVAILLDGIEARLRAIKVDQELFSRKQALTEAVTLTLNEIEEIDQIHRNQQVAVVQELSKIRMTMEERFITIGLTDAQESSLLEVIGTAENNTEELYQKGIELDERFARILGKLQATL